MNTTNTPSRAEIESIAYQHGFNAAHHFWQLDRPEYDHAVEWVRNADEGTLHDTYDIPSCDDCAPADLDTRGWSWLDTCLYAEVWEQAYLDETTKLCRQVIAADSPQFGNETACDNCGDEWSNLNDDELCPECAEAKS